IERIAKVLQELAPDIVCLQEVHQRLPWSGMVDQPKNLARALDMTAMIQANYRVGIGRFGNCILTRLPIVSKEQFVLNNPRERRSILRYPEKRGLQTVRVKAGNGPLVVMNTHWSLDAQDRIGMERPWHRRSKRTKAFQSCWWGTSMLKVTARKSKNLG